MAFSSADGVALVGLVTFVRRAAFALDKGAGPRLGGREERDLREADVGGRLEALDAKPNRQVMDLGTAPVTGRVSI